MPARRNKIGFVRISINGMPDWRTFTEDITYAGRIGWQKVQVICQTTTSTTTSTTTTL